jgi:DNA repair protein RAD16
VVFPPLCFGPLVEHLVQVTHRGAGGEKDVCGICHEPAEDAIISGCKHVFCRADMRLYLDSTADEVCIGFNCM